MGSNIENIDKKNNENTIVKKDNSTLRKIILSPYLLIFLLSAGVYFQTLFFGVTGLDDDFYFVEDNPQLSGHLNDIKDAFQKNYLDLNFYRPIINLTFLFNMKAGGSSPFIYHLTNLIIHVITSLLIFVFFRKLKFIKQASLIGALIFAVHPIFTDAVVWIVGRCDVLAAMFSILALIFFIQFMEKEKWRYLIFHSFSLLLAVFSKEVALLLPLVAGIYWLLYARDKRLDLKRIILITVWIILLIIFPLIKSALNLPLVGEEFNLTYIWVHIRAIPEVIAWTFIPLNQRIPMHYTLFPTISGVLLIIAMLIGAFAQKKFKNKRLIFGVSWFIFFLVPGFFISYSIEEQVFDYLECRFYLPIIGLFIAMIELLPVTVYEMKGKIFKGMLVLILVILSFLTITQSARYKDQVTFWLDVLDGNPELSSENQFISVVNRIFKKGLRKVDAGDIEGALVDFNHTLLLDTTNHYYFETRGFYRIEAQDYEGAFEDFSRAIMLKPSIASAYYQRAYLKMEFEDYIGAIRDLNQVIKLQPDSFLSYYQRGVAKYKLRDFLGAIDDCSMSIRLKSGFYNAFLQRGLAKIEAGQKNEACIDFRFAARLGSRQAYALLQEYCMNNEQ